MTKIEVSLAEGPAQPAQIRDRDAELDLAVLELAQPGLKQGQHAAELASAMSVEMGDPVFAMGAPRKMTFSLARGIVSYVGRPYDQVYFLQTDIATNSGSSGGPVLDDRGRVIGISSFILRDSQGLAFALPIDYAYKRFTKFFANALDTTGFDSWLAQRTARRAQPKLVVSGGSPKN
jgi:serine protease Do